MNDRARLQSLRSGASRFGAFAVGAALLAALIIPMLVVILAGPGLDSTDGHAVGDAAGIASAAVGGAQRLVAGGRDAVPVALPLPTRAIVRPADRAASSPAPERALEPAVASSDAASAPDEARLD